MVRHDQTYLMGSGTYAVQIVASFWGDAEMSLEHPLDFHRLWRVTLLHERGFCGKLTSTVDGEVSLVWFFQCVDSVLADWPVRVKPMDRGLEAPRKGWGKFFGVSNPFLMESHKNVRSLSVLCRKPMDTRIPRSTRKGWGEVLLMNQCRISVPNPSFSHGKL